jgi:hypothetical protein
MLWSCLSHDSPRWIVPRCMGSSWFWSYSYLAPSGSGAVLSCAQTGSVAVLGCDLPSSGAVLSCDPPGFGAVFLCFTYSSGAIHVYFLPGYAAGGLSYDLTGSRAVPSCART